MAVPEAAAQSSRFDVSGGYQTTRAADQIFAAGWSADVSSNLNDVWGIVAEISGTHREEADADLGADVTLSIHSFGGGLRWSKRGSRIVPFLQMLAGATRMSAQAEVQGTEIGESVVKVMLQPGGGIEVRLNERLGVVGQADYRRVFLDESDGQSGENQVRVFLGVRFGL
jgi:hypothetical protein